MARRRVAEGEGTAMGWTVEIVPQALEVYAPQPKRV